MRSVARVFKDEFDEVTMSSTEVFEANVVAIRNELTEFKAEFRDHKAEFRAAVARLESDIKSAVSKLETEIRSIADKAAKDLQQFADRVERQFSELRAENTEIRKTLADLTGLVIKIDRRLTVVDSRLGAIVWVGGGLIALVTLAISVVKTFEWLYWL